ncbi:flavin-containing monooxygenase [Methylobacterium isbiliense]|uniref:Phenylacetone monooxygenase n=1 Tax=Methylobacterium isbiliense TaxID=315478 RepID=A0ABQ4S5M9_9HYPH|nr:NAD(P)/FAD-dependent oxidoreductase [Methylobacterium isbiliense]MDN3622814.1 NAD(P)/FAD-dependent oxidoreductase [Methylobacterium isbiliense]GJD98381.1 Phenylacetone monooxygenase [Methylobacterium isbiliense]
MAQTRAQQPTSESRPARTYDAIIVGAGFSGLYQLHCLRDRLGLSVRVLEAADGVGGTWYWNRYPGARCDSESYYYSYSFSPELEQDWEWTERYPEHSEILRYLNHVAERFDLLRDIQFETRVTGAAFDEARDRWSVTTASGERFEAPFLITAVGCLSAANVPAIEGLERFAGEWYHTGRWPHEGVDFAGKRVGLIGTGSTGIQATPVIAAQAAHLTVFQRTANYSVPARNGPMSPEVQREIKANYAAIREKARASTNGHPFDVSEQSALDVTEEERRARYEAAWERGGLRFRAVFRDLLLDKAANDTASEFIRAKIRSIVKDPEVAAKLTPTDHPFASKRPPIDTDYFETFNRDNVLLVDLKATPIEEIVPEGVRTRDATYPLDVIVFATGFDALTGPLLALDIRGSGGRPLKEAWAAGPRTYLGLQTPGFPNLFTITGPGSPSVLTNMPIAIEQHVEWITRCIAHLRERGLARIEATPEATEAWVAHVNEAAHATLLPMANSSWYLGANVPGKPRVFMPYAGGMARYRSHCEAVAAKGYEGFALR